MALFKKKIPREFLVHTFAKQALEDTEGALQAFSRYIGGDEAGTPLTGESQFTKELLALNFSIRGGGFVEGVFPKAPDHMQNGLNEMVQRLGSVGGSPQSFAAYLVPWKGYRLGDPAGPLPSGLERHIAQGPVGKLVEISLAAWNNTVANIKIVE